jgi:hypothetical protein
MSIIIANDINTTVDSCITMFLNSFAGNLSTLMRSVAIYVLASLTGIFIHILITLPTVFFLYTGENPYEWLYVCRKAMLVALSTSSSVSELIAYSTPLSISLSLCRYDPIHRRLHCPLRSAPWWVQGVYLRTWPTLFFLWEQTSTWMGKLEPICFVVVFKSGRVLLCSTGIGFPCVIMFLAYADHLENKLNFFTWVNVALGSTLGSIGAAPVPSAGESCLFRRTVHILSYYTNRAL